MLCLDLSLRSLRANDKRYKRESYRLPGGVINTLRDEANIELIFLDIKMPKMDGFEALKKLRSSEKTKNVPILILSNFDEQELIEKGMTLGANEYLIKSQFTPEGISKKIKDWLGD